MQGSSCAADGFSLGLWIFCCWLGIYFEATGPCWLSSVYSLAGFMRGEAQNVKCDVKEKCWGGKQRGGGTPPPPPPLPSPPLPPPPHYGWPTASCNLQLLTSQKTPFCIVLLSFNRWSDRRRCAAFYKWRGTFMRIGRMGNRECSVQ